MRFKKGQLIKLDWKQSETPHWVKGLNDGDLGIFLRYREDIDMSDYIELYHQKTGRTYHIALALNFSPVDSE